jgi:hypothetical protein
VNWFEALAAVLVVGYLALWNALPLLDHIRSGHNWTTCGTFSSPQPRRCYFFLDMRHRPVRAECTAPFDDSGYIRLTQGRWWEYRPSRVTSQREGEARASVQLGPEASDPSCSALVELP